MKDFKKYAEQAREDFAYEISKYTVSDNLALRTKADSLLIAFDQAVAKALIIDGVSERLRGLVDRMQIVSDLKYPDRKYTPEFKDTMLKLWKGKESELEQRVIILEKEINVC